MSKRVLPHFVPLVDFDYRADMPKQGPFSDASQCQVAREVRRLPDVTPTLHYAKPTLEYAAPTPRREAGIAEGVGGFIGGWFLGVVTAGVLADLLSQRLTGHPHDGSMYLIPASAFVIEAPMLALLRLLLGPRLNGLYACLFGWVWGPLLLVMALVGR